LKRCVNSLQIKKDYSPSTSSSPTAPSITPTVQVSSASPVVSNSSVSMAHLPSQANQDVQAQMMVMLSDSFSKLSLALSEKSNLKSDWPKFSGDVKKFRSWYLAIIAQLSLPPWQEFYDTTRNDITPTTTNTWLNGKLYSKLLLALDGIALQSTVSKKYLRANGLLLLQDLVQTYKPKNVPEVIAAKTGEFWSNTKRHQNESIDAYFNRFQELLEDLSDAAEPISQKSATHHFLSTLGSEFEAIQNNYRIGNLPPAWQTDDWPTLLTLCRDYYNSIKPFGSNKKEASGQSPGNNNSAFDRLGHQKKIRQWFMQPGRYCKEIEKEQLKHPDMCIFHLTKSHSTAVCQVKKDCEKQLAEQQSKTSPSTHAPQSSGRLRHIQDDLFEDAVVDSVSEIDQESNITNDDVLNYFARVTNHYLRLIRNNSSTSIPIQHNMKYPVIADSGANFHMFCELEFFTSLAPAQGHVIFSDGITRLPIHGIGTVTCSIGSDKLCIENVRYVPDLSESIYSLFCHIQSPGHSVYSSFEEGIYIVFPQFKVQAILGESDIYLDMVPTTMVRNSPLLKNCSFLKFETVH
jgi:hypothetical protein